MDRRYDLHMHSKHSDGSMSVEELFIEAKSKKLLGVSITDHDSIGGYEHAFEFAEEYGLKLITGVELSTLYEGQSVHVLGYGFNHKNTFLVDYIRLCQKIREDRNLAILDKLKQYQMPIEEDQLSDYFENDLKDMGRPHFAQMMVKMGYVKDFREAFNLYLADDKKCFVKGERPTTENAIESLHKANALAIIAHPHFIRSNKLTKALLNMPFDGLEGYYARMRLDQERKWIQLAKNRNWLITGGSDFHGECKPLNIMGASWVNEETYQIIKKHQDRNYDV